MKRSALLLMLAVLLAITAGSFAQEKPGKKMLAGTWMGAIKVNAIELRLVFNIKIIEPDSLVATMDSPDQGAKGIPLGQVSLIGDSLRIKAPLLLGEYKGLVRNDTSIAGTWSQSGQTFPLNIYKLREQFTINRPQEPKAPFPYSSKDVTFPNKKFNFYLGGTLTMPYGDGPFPAVVLITGSGSQDRNETVFGHKPFLVIADFLTRNGIAVLRYDDRGIGGSQGSPLNSTSADLATDAEAAFLFLKENPKIKSDAIGLMGHSEGGLIAPIVAASERDVAFIISLAGTGVNGEEIEYRQQADILRLMGASEEEISESHETNKKLYSVLRKEKDDQKAEAKVISAYRKILQKRGASPENIDKAVSQLLASFNTSSFPWFRYFLITDPSSFWKQVKCPVLALNGEKDTQVAADINLPAIENALKSSGNSNVKTVSLPGLNHLFQHCTTGLPSEYSSIEETFSPEALEIISDWITGLKVSR